MRRYLRWDGGIRYGLILEDMDALAGNVAHTHADDDDVDTKLLHIVTACVDTVKIHHLRTLSERDGDFDLELTGCVQWVGRSSMLIRLELDQVGPVSVGRRPLAAPLVCAHVNSASSWSLCNSLLRS